MTKHRTDVVVVGAGFAGLRALHTLRGLGLSVAVLEAGDGIGGVWHWNRYPGARCDIVSHDYSYGFSPELEQEWRWSERYATQPEILRYVEHVADRFDLRRDVHLHRRVTTATWDEQALRWAVGTEDGDEWSARFLIKAVGNLSTTKRPLVEGLEDFRGEVLHTAEWPKEPVALAGRRVGVIGTGSSGIQSIPLLAEEAEHLTVFQRTPAFSVPAKNAPVTDEQDAAVKADYAARRRAAADSPSGLGFVPNRRSALEDTPEQRRATYERAWDGDGFGFVLAYHDLLLDRAANDTAADFIREKIEATVEDPDVRARLLPTDYPFGAKRPCVDSGYYETFNREDVTLVDVRETPIERVTETGVRTSAGDHELDVLVLATGFDAITGSLLRPTITGRGGRTLAEAWAAGPETYLGLGVHGFPNLLVITGPGSPGLLANVLLGIEQHVDWIAALLTWMEERGHATVEVDRGAQESWTAHVLDRAAQTLYPSARSYYMGDEIEGKPRVFMAYPGGIRQYRRIIEGVAERGYEGFLLDGEAGGTTGGGAPAAARA